MSDVDLFIASVCAAVALVAFGHWLGKHEVLERAIRWAHGRGQIKVRIPIDLSRRAR